MSWLNDAGDASKHPWRVLTFMFVFGLTGGGAIGYFRFDRSLVWASVAAVAGATILGYYGWKLAREPAWAQGPRSRGEFGKGLLRLAWPFLVLAVAFAAGIATRSAHVFIVVVAVGLALGLALRFTVWR
jgi:hypothetical protein